MEHLSNLKSEKKSKEKNSRYFQDALSDFVFDAASGRAIRHLADRGYTTAQILKQLDYPTPFAKIQHAVTRHFKETGILLDELPIPSTELKEHILNRNLPERLYRFLIDSVNENGEENSYVSCPYGIYRGSLSVLTTREREYIEGIAWEPKIMYHRLNRRMLEISVQTAVCTEEICFYFLKTRLVFR